jgi:ABC-2 type transport system ATP-binding protein
MHQRLGIAQALLHRPPVLLLDEPTSSLDPAGRYEVLDLLDKLRGAFTVFFSTHILADVERICDTIAIIHKGQLLLVAGRDELRERYPLNTAVLERDTASPPWPETFVAGLQAQPWITGVTQEGTVLRVVVNDVAHGKQALLPLVLQQDIILTRYEWVRPTLEEIFLKVSA